MADKRELTILLRAKNAMAAGLSSAGASLKNFGVGVWNIGKKAALGLLAIGTALAGVAVKAVSSYAESEAAVESLASALRVNGDEVDANVKKLQARAAAIQDETGASDDGTVATMARLRMLGVEAGALEAAAKGVIALKSAGLEEEAATKAVAMAHAGNFGALAKYIPALKNATTEAEKAALVNDFLTKGYAQQKDKLNTVSGAWGLLKERVGDVWEEVGKAIAQNAGLQSALTQAGDKVKEFGQRVADWAGSGGVTKLIAGVLTFVENTRHGWNLIGLSWDLMVSKIADGIQSWLNWNNNRIEALVNVWITAATTIKGFWIAVFEKIKHPLSKFDPPSLDPLKKAIGGYVESWKWANAKTSAATDAINKRIEREYFRHYNRLAEITAQKNDALNAPPPAPVAAAKAEPIVVAQENAEKARLAAEKKANEERLAMIDAEIAARQKLLSVQQELAAKTVAGYIAEAKAKKTAEEALAKDQERADKIRKKIERDSKSAFKRKLSREDQEFIKAANLIKDAQKGAPANAKAIDQLAAERDKIQGRIAKATEEIAKIINQAITFGGG